MFTTHPSQILVRTALAAAALGIAAVLATGTAGATPADDEYLAILTQQHLGFGNPQSAIAVAHHVCDALDGGMEPSDISRHLTAANSGIDQQAGLVITVAAAQAYCPRFVHQMANGTIVVGPDH